MAERRKLPVLQNTPEKPAPAGDSDAVEERPPWHWAGFGVVAIYAAWLPLSYVGGAISKQLIAGVTSEQMASASDAERARLMVVIALPTLIALALGAFGGGYIVGRFGTGPGQRIGAVSGGVTALIAIGLAFKMLTWGVLLISLLVVGAVAIGFAALGGRVGAKRRS